MIIVFCKKSRTETFLYCHYGAYFFLFSRFTKSLFQYFNTQQRIINKALLYLCFQMKRSILILVSIFLSALIVYSGSGVNAYFYCCNDCFDEGTAAVTEHKCCEVHHHHHLNGLITHYDDHRCDQNISAHPDACGVERISVDWSVASQNGFNLQPAIIDINFGHLFKTQNITFEPELDASVIKTPSQKPPNLSKDDYFSLLTILII